MRRIARVSQPQAFAVWTPAEHILMLSKGPGFALPDVLGGELKLAQRTHALILVLCPLFPLPSPSLPLLLLSDVQRRPTPASLTVGSPFVSPRSSDRYAWRLGMFLALYCISIRILLYAHMLFIYRTNVPSLARACAGAKRSQNFPLLLQLQGVPVPLSGTHVLVWNHDDHLFARHHHNRRRHPPDVSAHPHYNQIDRPHLRHRLVATQAQRRRRHPRHYHQIECTFFFLSIWFPCRGMTRDPRSYSYLAHP